MTAEDIAQELHDRLMGDTRGIFTSSQRRTREAWITTALRSYADSKLDEAATIFARDRLPRAAAAVVLSLKSRAIEQVA